MKIITDLRLEKEFPDFVWKDANGVLGRLDSIWILNNQAHSHYRYFLTYEIHRAGGKIAQFILWRDGKKVVWNITFQRRWPLLRIIKMSVGKGE